MSHRTSRPGFRLAALVLGAAFALALPASSARASAPNGRYTIGTGTVTDNFTQLVWEQAVHSKKWPGATSYCTSLSLANKSDWRVPSIKELMTLVDFSVSSGPTIDAKAFPKTLADTFWSSSVFAGLLATGWCVNFSDGTAGSCAGGVFNMGHVRCVRGGSVP